MNDDTLAQLALLDALEAAQRAGLPKGTVVDLKDPNFYFHCPCDVCAVHPTPHPTGTLPDCKFVTGK